MICDLDQRLSVMLQSKHDRHVKVEIAKNQNFEEVIKQFCCENNFDDGNVRFFYDGQRISYNDTAHTLGLENGDFIDVCFEITGGGWPTKKRQDIDDDTITQLLNLSENNADISIGKKETVEKSVHLKFFDSGEMIIDSLSNKKSDGKQNKYPSQKSGNITTNEEREQDNSIFKNQNSLNTEDQTLLEDLQRDFDNGILNVRNKFDSGIIHYLKQKTIAPIEMKALKCLLERKKIFESEFLKERPSKKRKLDPGKKDDLKTHEKSNEPNNRKISSQCTSTEQDNVNLENITEQDNVNLENNTQQDNDNLENITEQHNVNLENITEQDNVNLENNTEQDNVNLENITEQDNVNLENITFHETPSRRRNILTKFGTTLPSPIQPSDKSAEAEMKRISLAIHFWAETKKGGTGFLHKHRLKNEDFGDIIYFAGPGTCHNLIENNSIFQLKHLWRNTAKTNSNFSGHPDTGFEDINRFHNSSLQYCPFGHCNIGTHTPMSPLDMDLILMTPKMKQNGQGNDRRIKKNLFNSSNEASRSDRTSMNPISYHTSGSPSSYSLSARTRMEVASPSPTKEELRRQNKRLQDELKILKQSGKTKILAKESEIMETKEEDPLFVIKCNVKDCSRQFISSAGLVKHQKKEHSGEDILRNPEPCKICGKIVVQMEKHIKTVHKNLCKSKVCEICQQVIKSDIKKHRGQCTSCPYCGKIEINRQKGRLIKHITKCKILKMKMLEQSAPLDLSTPKKKEAKGSMMQEQHEGEELKSRTQEAGARTVNIPASAQAVTAPAANSPDITTAPGVPTIVNPVGSPTVPKSERHQKLSTPQMSQLLPSRHEQRVNDWNRKRRIFPFDNEDENESYHSEFEKGDSEEYTTNRRRNKDFLELNLRKIDEEIYTHMEGDDIIIPMFRKYMENQYRVGINGGKNHFPSTVAMYTNAIIRDILPAFHALHEPFNSCWLLDCTTAKNCKFDGKERAHVKPEEPIYLTSKVLRKALEKYDRGEVGEQRATLIAATRQFMNFIELEFEDKMGLYGREPLEKIITYHNALKAYLSGTKTWKVCNEEKQKTQQENKVIKDIVNPNHEAKILSEFHNYLNSEQRHQQIKKIIDLAKPNSRMPTRKEFTECGQTCMGELCMSTGCRPIVVCRLPNSGYTNKKPAFTPFEMTEDILQESELRQRRVNPNLPPAHLACTHQKEQQSAICPVQCDERCEPIGFNIEVNWDKTSPTNGISILHIAKPLKDLLDMYHIIKKRYFSQKEEYVEDSDMTFFINSSGSSFQQLKLKHISIAMGVDVTAYAFRRIVSTWALSHRLEEIRNAETEALQHSFKVATNAYKQNKQLKPQILTQTFIEEEGFFPENIEKEITQMEKSTIKSISITEETRQRKQKENLIQGKKSIKKLRQDRRPLGPRQTIHGSDKNKFKEILTQITGEDIIRNLNDRTSGEWRDFFVRNVCSSTGELGESIRLVWASMYRGDLRFGVRELRRKAEEKNWPDQDHRVYTRGKDRNSWIAGALLNTLHTEKKNEQKN